jgi:hypothetical protein
MGTFRPRAGGLRPWPLSCRAGHAQEVGKATRASHVSATGERGLAVEGWAERRRLYLDNLKVVWQLRRWRLRLPVGLTLALRTEGNGVRVRHTILLRAQLRRVRPGASPTRTSTPTSTTDVVRGRVP